MRWALVALAAALVTVTPLGIGTAAREGHGDWARDFYERYQALTGRGPAFEELQRTDFVLDTPVGLDGPIRLDWRTRTLNAMDPRAPDGASPARAGCVAPVVGLAFRWNHEPLAVDSGCTHDYLEWPAFFTTLACGVVPTSPFAASCWTDGIHFSFIDFGFFILTCQPGAATVKWPGGAMTSTPTCTLFTTGTEPTEWTFWDSLCVGSGFGVVACAQGQ